MDYRCEIHIELAFRSVYPRVVFATTTAILYLCRHQTPHPSPLPSSCDVLYLEIVLSTAAPHLLPASPLCLQFGPRVLHAPAYLQVSSVPKLEFCFGGVRVVNSSPENDSGSEFSWIEKWFYGFDLCGKPRWFVFLFLKKCYSDIPAVNDDKKCV